MCGIAGFLCKQNGMVENFYSAMQTMAHRGPDDQGFVFVDRDGQLLGTGSQYENGGGIGSVYLALGQIRFSLVDLTKAGHQPFFTDDGKICIIFNGEIYNYVEVRVKLEALGVTFSTRTDTEVFAKAYGYWGVECFSYLSGFWATVIYDQTLNKVLVARDRLGKAPLYICQNQDGLFWASEINSLLKLVPSERKNINDQSVLHFANWQKRDFNNSTFYKNITTFPRASYAWVDEQGGLDIHEYWGLQETRMSESEISVTCAIDQFKHLIDDAVRIRVRADAPVAVQLSGGMDSSTLLASVANHADRIDAYTVEYGYGPQNEEPYARMVADMYRDKVNYHVVNPVDQDLMLELPDYAKFMAEPYHSPNQLSSQHIWRKMASTGIRAVIYGGGGDEVFAGYSSEYFAPYLRQLLSEKHGARFLKEFFSSSEYARGFPLMDYIKMAMSTFSNVPRRSTHGSIPFIAEKMNPLNIDLLGIGQRKPSRDLNEKLAQNMGDWRMNYWLRIDNQNSMGVPVELRSPLLDHRVVEFAYSLPASYLIRDGWFKWIVRKAMEDELPAEVVWRRQKMGFPFPLTEWLGKNFTSFKRMLIDTDCPYVRSKQLFKYFHELNSRDSEYLWGLISILMWWKFVVTDN
jgi:asparagine synthase (glutamine-hydrolysing)